MDKEEARFILRCFRPDGSDATRPEFAEALQLAASDRELGDWLARERAQDAEFSSVLGSVPLPEGLRDELLAGMALERGDLPQADDIDAPLIGALAMVRPPEGLRDEIVAAMSQSEAVTDRSTAFQPVAGGKTPRTPKPKTGSGWWRFAVPLAAAAGIAFAFFVNSSPEGLDGDHQAGTGVSQGRTVPVSFVQSEAIATIESADFSLDLMNPDQAVLFEFIRKQGKACPSGHLPEGLEKVPGLGCRLLEFGGKSGTLICFRVAEGQIVHLVMFRRDDVEGDLPGRGQPQMKTDGDWSVAQWENGDRVFMVLGKTGSEQLESLF